MNDQRLEERLRTDSRRPIDVPSLDDLVLRAVPTQRRPAGAGAGRWIAVAASVLLIVAAAAAVGLGRQRPSERSRPAATASSSRPTIIVRDGERLRLVRQGTWFGAVLDPDDPRLLHVYADRQPDGPCPWPPQALLVQQTKLKIVLSVGYYRGVDDSPPATPPACVAVKYAAGRLDVRLDAPLGDRLLVDVSSPDTAAVVVRADRVPRASLPTSFDGGTVTYGLTSFGGSATARRKYVNAGRTAITVVLGPDDVLGRVVARTTVDGQPAEVVRATGFGSDLAVRWTDPQLGDLSVAQTAGHRAGDGALTQEQLVAVARSLSR